jgi:hypothetical protein
MNNLNVAKFIQQDGLKTAIIVAVVVLVFSFWIFYSYGFGSISLVSDLQFNSPTLKEGLVNNVLSDLNSRESNLAKLKQTPISVSDIFR